MDYNQGSDAARRIGERKDRENEDRQTRGGAGFMTSPFDTPAFDDALGTPRSSGQPLPPPVGFLVITAFALLVSLVLVPAGAFSDLAHVGGWLMASVVGIGSIAAFTASDMKRRERPNYSPRPTSSHARVVLAVAAIVLCGLHAWVLAWSLAAR